jgi:hypothetical protein
MRREWSDVGLGRFAELDSYDVEACMEHLVSIWNADGVSGHETTDTACCDHRRDA